MLLRKHNVFILIWKNDLSYEDRLIKLGLPSLEFRRHRGDMIGVFKITNKIYDTQTTNTFFDFSESITRKNGKKLTKHHVNFKPFQEFFTNRTINLWNSLPGKIVNADCVNDFKNYFDNLYRAHMYQTNMSIGKEHATLGHFSHWEHKD